MSRCFLHGALAVGFGLLLGPGRAAAQPVEVTPVQVELTSEQQSGLVTIKNLGDAPVRYQVSAYAWDQDRKGEMLLSRTKDLNFFPSLLTIGPREERNLRVAAAAPFGAVEKTYRLFVEQLPDKAPAKGVRVLTRVGIPVYLEPRQPVVKGEAEALALGGGRFSFLLRNSGTTRIRPDHVRVVGKDAAGVALFEEKLACWYVLAGGARAFEVKIPPDACARVRALAVEADLGLGGKVAATLPAPSGACGP